MADLPAPSWIVVLHHDEDTAVRMLAALKECPKEQRLDTLAVVVKAFVEKSMESMWQS